MKKYIITVNGTSYEVVVEEADPNATYTPKAEAPKAEAPKAEAPKAEAPKAAAAPAGNGEQIKAPMPGTILKVAVSNGQAVKKGDLVCVLEAMKMENEIFAPCDGTVTSVTVSQGATVSSGDVLCTIA